MKQPGSTKVARGKIYLIPSALGPEGTDAIPDATRKIINDLFFFIVENERSARRFLRSIGYTRNFDEVILQKTERDEDFSAGSLLVDHLSLGHPAGVLSEAGCPGIADPGAAAVRWAHEQGFQVVPLPGPSSIFLALMASGLNGQQFAFHGYLPIAATERKNRLKQLEEESKRKNQTQVFMETPYRNEALLKDLLGILKNDTQLCIAMAITLPSEDIFTQPVGAWKNRLPDLKKKPAIFLILAT